MKKTFSNHYVYNGSKLAFWDLLQSPPLELPPVDKDERMYYYIPGMIKAFVSMLYHICFPDLLEKIKFRSLNHYPSGGKIAEKTKRLFAVTFGEADEHPFGNISLRAFAVRISRRWIREEKGRGRGKFDGSYSLGP